MHHIGGGGLLPLHPDPQTSTLGNHNSSVFLTCSAKSGGHLCWVGGGGAPMSPFQYFSMCHVVAHLIGVPHAGASVSAQGPGPAPPSPTPLPVWMCRGLVCMAINIVTV